MPLPVWLIPIAVKGAAAVAGAIGVGSAIHGASKMKEANNTMESARSRHEKNVARFEEEQTYTNKFCFCLFFLHFPNFSFIYVG